MWWPCLRSAFWSLKAELEDYCALLCVFLSVVVVVVLTLLLTLLLSYCSNCCCCCSCRLLGIYVVAHVILISAPVFLQ